MKGVISLVVAVGFVFFMPACKSGGGDVDLSTPKKSVQSLLKASKNKDQAGLKKVFSENAEGEFDKYQKGKDLDEMAKFAKGAEVGEVLNKSDKKATVKVKLKNGDEEIDVEKTDKGWQVVGF